MGGQPWFYFVPYEKDIDHALQRLKDREFRAGRYNPVIPFPEFPVDEHSKSPGARHKSIEKALEASMEDGTRSILDMVRVGEENGAGVVTPVDEELLQLLYGTIRPSREQVEANMSFLEDIERGEGIYIVTYRDGAPSEILFAGYSYD